MPPTCYDKAVQLLGSRPHFRRELQAKLAQRGFPSEEIQDALDRLTALGYLDDAKTAVSFVEQRLARGAEGKVRLKAELEKRGATSEAISGALAALAPDDDREPAREAAERWARLHPRGDGAALARHLARKGFTRRAIVAALNERPGQEDLDLDGIEES